MLSIIGVFAVNVVIYLSLPIAFAFPAPAMIMMLVWGFAGYFIAAPIQIRVVKWQSTNLASTLLQSALNLGNAIGPLVGAVALGAGLPYALLPLIGAVAATGGLGTALLSPALDRRAMNAAVA
jgi:MFS transporter, DHA1 family, inner membrane transport protein